MDIPTFHVTTLEDLDGSEIQLESSDAVPDIRQLRLNGEDARLYSSPKYRNVPRFEDAKTNISKYHNYVYQHQKAIKSQLEQPTKPNLQRASKRDMQISAPSIVLPPSEVHVHPSQQLPHRHNNLQTIPEDNYFGYSPGQVVNIKEIKAPVKVKPKRRVHFADSNIVEPGTAKHHYMNEGDFPIPCNPVDCPESRQAIENGRLKHSLPIGDWTSGQPQKTNFHGSHDPVNSPSNSSTLQRGHLFQRNTTPCASTSGSLFRSRTSSSSQIVSNASLRDISPLQTPPIAEVEGDSIYYRPFSSGIVGQSSGSSERHHISPWSDSEHSPAHGSADELFHYRDARILETRANVPHDTVSSGPAQRKSKEILKKLWGSRSSRYSDSGRLPFHEKLEINQQVRYANLDSRKEWAFVAISPDTRTIVGVCDREVFMTYSMEASGIRLLLEGEFEGEPLTIVASNHHLAILTLTKLQIFDHHTGGKIYESTADKTGGPENFTGVVFSNSGLELCVGLTDGTVQFHFIAGTEDEENEGVVFHRGDPRMDISLSSGDYPFTMSFSDDDMRFACGTQKRLLLVYEFRGAAGWELRNKFKFSDWEPGTHRRISGAVFCADNRFLLATTTSGRSSAYMYCIDNKRASCSQSISYPLPITKKGISRSALSPNGKSIAMIDGDGIVYKCDFRAASILSEKQEFTRVPGALIPARACWVSWTNLGDLIVLDKKGHLRVYELAAGGSSPR